MTPFCYFCEKPLEHPEKEYRRVLGWEAKRHGGGLNGLRLREELEEFACRSCVEMESKGVSARQGGLL